MKEISTETLIIGAGPAGMATAMELSKADKDFIIVEKDDVVGGLARTYSFTETDGMTFYTDNGPHRFFSKNQYLYEFIDELLGEDWITVNRQTRQYIDGKYFDYPINAIQALKNVGIKTALKMLIDYVIARVQYQIFEKPIRSFKDYVWAYFGKTLGEFNMINYTEKIWGIDAGLIHPDWAGQRIKGLNLWSVAKDTIGRFFGQKSVSPKSLVETFYYPKHGTGQIYETIKQRIELKGYQALLSTWPTSITKNENGFVTRLINTKGEKIEIKHHYLVESIPITEFVTILKEPIPDDVKQAIQKLKYRSQVYLFITINKPELTNDQWIYFPSKEIIFGRISEMKNFSPCMSPKDKTSLFIEFFCDENDNLWNMSAEKLLSSILPVCERAGLFRKSDIRHAYHIKKKNIYPVYDLCYKDNLDVVKKYLNSISGLIYIGRPGRFKYNNQDHSLEMGILAAKSIIEKRKYNMEDIGEEKEYFEKGIVPNNKIC